MRPLDSGVMDSPYTPLPPKKPEAFRVLLKILP
jgi:hypothetical protein